MGVNKVDHKLKIIVGLSFALVVLLMFVGATTYNNKQTSIYNQGLQDGALLQQRNMIQTVQATGFYSINLVDESGNPLRVVLAPVQPQQQAQQ